MTAKKKKLIKGLVAVALIAIIGIGATLAYLSFTTTTKSNKFTSDKTAEGSLREDNWNKKDDTWSDYSPGDVAAKDPIIYNDSTDVNTYVAMKVTCTANNLDNQESQGEITFADLQEKYVDLFSGNSTYNDTTKKNVVDTSKITSTSAATGLNLIDWYATSQDGFYVYKTSLAPGAHTNPLFDAVRVKTGIYTLYTSTTTTGTVTYYKENADGTKGDSLGTKTIFVSSDTKVIAEDANGNRVDVGTKLPSFTITVTGYGVQTNNLTLGDATAKTTGTAVDELAKLAGYTGVKLTY